MILIHLASGSVLKEACAMFGRVIIPQAVHREVVEKGIEKGRADAHVVERLERSGELGVVAVKEKKLMAELARYGLRGGELEAVALYFQENADLLATNDDKVRSLHLALRLNLVSSPEIIAMMVKRKAIAKERALQCLSQLRKTGWFSPDVLDLIIEEVRKN